MKIAMIIVGILIVIYASVALDRFAHEQASYQGLPTVPCLDYTKPKLVQFTFNITIHINGQNYPLERTIGHDYGNCLHDIYVNDSSGTVHVASNDQEMFTLGQFFDTWHKTFSSSQIFNYHAGDGHSIRVFVNKEPVNTYRETVLQPGEDITITYE